MKRQAIDWEKIIAKQSDKVLLSRSVKNIYNSIIRWQTAKSKNG